MSDLQTVRAYAEGVNQATRKVALVASLVRNRTVADALVILSHTPKRAALPVVKAIESAKANAINISGKTPVFNCSFNYSVELLNLLVEYGADINARDKYKNTLLHDDYINCFDDHFEEFLKTLISLGFDINSKNTVGYTPLDLCENKKISDILIKYNANK